MRSFFKRPDCGLTLIEVLVTLAILLLILTAVMEGMTAVDQGWKEAATDPFTEAQDAFDTVAHTLAGATLASYEDYADATGAFRASASFVPDHLARRSDLAFVCGPSAGAGGVLSSSGRTTTGSGVFFVAPGGFCSSTTYAHTGMEHLLNAMGYVVEFSNDSDAPGFILSGPADWHWRLEQVMQPTESLQIFTTGTSAAWIQQLVPAGSALSVLADNVVTLIVLPERAANDSGAAIAPAYSYDSRDASNALTLHQLPPRVHLALVAMDAASAQKLAAQNGTNAPQLVAPGLFQQAANLDADLASLDSSLTAQKIGHRLFQREILLPASSWSNNTP
jgi:uncharacterized protein (TIGR02599 family)